MIWYNRAIATEEQPNGEVTFGTLAAMIKSNSYQIDIFAAIVKAGFDDVRAQMGELNEKIDAVDMHLRVEIKATREEMRQGFTKITSVLDNHEDRLTHLERHTV